MSLSNQSDAQSKWGTIYMGPTSANEATLQEVEGSRSMNWDDATEAEYLERVKVKAQAMAAEMLQKARAEGEALREQARQEGYQHGLEQAQQELETFQQTMGESVSGVLGAIQGQCSSIFDNWRQELVTMLRVSLQKALSIELDENRHTVLENLLTLSLEELDSKRNLVIKVNPEDAPAVQDIISLAQSRFPGLEAWSVKADEHIGTGGMVLESDNGMVDNTIESRFALVDNVLAQLAIPPEDAL